jgi:hypothetical protein
MACLNPILILHDRAGVRGGTPVEQQWEGPGKNLVVAFLN